MDSSALLYAHIPKHTVFFPLSFYMVLHDVLFIYDGIVYWLGKYSSVCLFHLSQRKSEAAELDAAEERLVLGGEAWGRETKIGFFFTVVETWNASCSNITCLILLEY